MEYAGKKIIDRGEPIGRKLGVPTHRAGGHPPAEPPAAMELDQFQKMIESLPESIALLDETGSVVATNHVWRRIIAQMGMEVLNVGGNYRDFCIHRGMSPDAAAIVAGLDDVASGRAKTFRHVYAGTDITQGRDYDVCISPVEIGGRRFLILANYDVTSERRLRRQVRGLESDILQVQSLERQRIGRDLHDSTAQELVALRLLLLQLKRLRPDALAQAVVSDIEATLEQMSHEIRAISYLLHPPALETFSLAEALEAMATGFARRTGLDISFRLEGWSESWDRLAEAALYRAAQEALANVHRHAHATQVRITLISRPKGFLHLVVDDNGVGVGRADGTARAGGVGISGMEARLRELGGRLSIRQRACGTRIAASLRAELDESRANAARERQKARARDRRLLSDIAARVNDGLDSSRGSGTSPRALFEADQEPV
jgi:two-component system, NarL family, sensor kinase